MESPYPKNTCLLPNHLRDSQLADLHTAIHREAGMFNQQPITQYFHAQPCAQTHVCGN